MTKYIIGGFIALGLTCAAAPSLNVPLVAPAVCSIKGGSWYTEPNFWAGVEKAGCYGKAN